MFALAFYAFLRIGEITTKIIWMEAKYYKYRMFLLMPKIKINGLSVVITNYKHSDLHAKTIFIPREIGNAAGSLVSFLPFRFCASFRIFLIRNELVGSARLFDLCTKLIAEI
jgi:hypothetical protein